MADIEVSDDAVVAEALTHRGELVGEDVSADDASAGLGQPQRDRPTLAPGRAGHHGDLVVELPHDSAEERVEARAVGVAQRAQRFAPAGPPVDLVGAPGICDGAVACRPSCWRAWEARRSPAQRPGATWCRGPAVGRGRRQRRRGRRSRRRPARVRPSRGRRRARRAPRTRQRSGRRDGAATMASIGAAAKFSPSTRSHSLERPAKYSQPVSVAVGEVSRPVPAVAETGCSWPRRSCNSPRSRWSARVSTISPIASSRLVGRPSAPKATGGHSSPVSASSTLTLDSADPKRPAGHRWDRAG